MHALLICSFLGPYPTGLGQCNHLSRNLLPLSKNPRVSINGSKHSDRHLPIAVVSQHLERRHTTCRSNHHADNRPIGPAPSLGG
ncbi:hypothetical protein F5Y12DRAFT_388236 [Xylaria sp. FL1777]|nr:hypothetical protein F5Y12DRAFT_388236 [Xylaria sp. FL1777]